MGRATTKRWGRIVRHRLRRLRPDFVRLRRAPSPKPGDFVKSALATNAYVVQTAWRDDHKEDRELEVRDGTTEERRVTHKDKRSAPIP